LLCCAIILLALAAAGVSGFFLGRKSPGVIAVAGDKVVMEATLDESDCSAAEDQSARDDPRARRKTEIKGPRPFRRCRAQYPGASPRPRAAIER
jgi:hypothetical protein